jgi:hypothetical protein
MGFAYGPELSFSILQKCIDKLITQKLSLLQYPHVKKEKMSQT